MMERSSYRRLAAAASIACIIAAAPDALAQGQQQNVTGGAGPQAGGESGGGENQYGWPTDFVAQVGAGTTNGTTTGHSGSDEAPAGSAEPSLPDLPSARLCDDWRGTDVYPFCIEKVTRE